MLKMIGDTGKNTVRREMPRQCHGLHGCTRNDNCLACKQAVNSFARHTLCRQTGERKPHTCDLVELGVHRSRTEGAHTHRRAGAAQLLAQGFCQAQNIVFGGVIGCHQRSRQKSRRGRHVENIAASALHKIPHSQLGENVYGTHVGVDHAQFLIQIGGDKLAEQAKTRVVDHDLQFLALYGLVQQAAFLLVRHVRRDDAARHRKLCRQFAQAFQNLQRCAAAAERVFGFLEEPEMEDESDKSALLGANGHEVKGDVEFSHVQFGYEPGKPIINDFSASVSAGQKVAIVGPTGAGKTTMVNLLMRFYEISGGSISIDGVDTKSVPRWNVHDQFSMVLQDTWVFRGTVRENIAYSKPDVTDKQIEDACKAVGLHHYIMSLPNGYDTVLDDKATLSQGQKQLLTIARAMVEDAPILILDEATSSVDTRTEELIQKAMDALTVDRTSFVIAHRLSTIRDADMILVMNHGDIVESGTHEELLAKGGFYADIYNSQFALTD